MADGRRERGRGLTLCCESSETAGEALWATAPEARVWISVEWSGLWGERALESADLPEPVRRLLLDLNAHREARVQFISRPDRRMRSGHYVFVARTDCGSLTRHTIGDYRELLDLEWQSALGDPVRWKESVGRELFLVCTNGRRDRCCALRGNPVFAAAEAALGPAAWQTTHLGGHRFAATAVSLPSGRVYGRLKPSDLRPVLAAEDTGDIWLERFRGHAGLPRFAQAAEYFLRRADVPGRYAIASNGAGGSGLKGAVSQDSADLVLGDPEQPPPDAGLDAGQIDRNTTPGDEQSVAFDTGVGRRTVTVSAALSDFSVFKSSGDVNPVPVPQYALVGIE